MAPADIRLLFSAAPSDPSRGKEAEKAQHTASLQQVLPTLLQYWLSNSSDLDDAAEILADGSRDPSWRTPIGESGILAFFLGIIATDQLRPRLKLHTLRLIGNSCADRDGNRALAVAGNHVQQIVALLADDLVLAFVIPVLFNVCVDYEPAQAQAGQADLSHVLTDIVTGPRLAQCRAFLSIIFKILGLLVRKEPEVPLVDVDTPVRLINFAISPDAALDSEEFYYLLSIVLTCLSHESFQAEVNKQGAVAALLTVFSDSYSKYDMADLDTDDLADFQQVRVRFTSIIADVMADPSFFAHYSITSPVVDTLQSWVRESSTDMHLQVAACYSLGNLARSDETSTYFVQTAGLHQHLFSLLATPSPSHVSSPDTGSADEGANAAAAASPQLHYAAISFLRNLAIPVSNRSLLGSLLDPPASILPRFWAISAQPRLQFASISLARLLVASCPENVRRICAPLSSDPSSPAREESNLHVLVEVFGRLDDENTKTEAARVFATICRVLHSSPQGPPVLSDDWEPTEADASNGAETDYPLINPQPSVDNQPRRAKFYVTLLSMADALTYLLVQTRYPALRSEAIFILALMSCTNDGARLAARALHPFEAWRMMAELVSGHDIVDGRELEECQELPVVLGGGASAVVATTNGKDYSNGFKPQPVSATQAGQTARSDRENGLVLLAEILKKYGNCMPELRRSMFEQTLQEGSLLVQQAREQE